MKRYFAALAIGGVVFGTVLASAADLGKITDGTLGSATAVIATCQPTNTISSDYRVSWDAAPDNRYEVTDVELKGLTSDCNGKRVKVALIGASNLKVAESATDVMVRHDGTGPDGTSGNQVIPVIGGPSATEVVGIRVTIYGE